jgi:hypothetical protein
MRLAEGAWLLLLRLLSRCTPVTRHKIKNFVFDDDAPFSLVSTPEYKGKR